MVTRQPQVERRTGKVRLSETDVLPLCHATNAKVYQDRLQNDCMLHLLKVSCKSMHNFLREAAHRQTWWQTNWPACITSAVAEIVIEGNQKCRPPPVLNKVNDVCIDENIRSWHDKRTTPTLPQNRFFIVEKPTLPKRFVTGHPYWL